jgi:hypothetical protein
MKSLLLILSLSTTLFSFSQTVNGTPVKEINVEYIEIVGRGKLFSTKLSVEIDFGQHNKVFNMKDTQIRDADGKLTVFNSMVDALNFFGTNGYTFQQAYTITVGNSNIYHFLMRKIKD